jgi:hypothetical protein
MQERMTDPREVPLIWYTTIGNLVTLENLMVLTESPVVRHLQVETLWISLQGDCTRKPVAGEHLRHMV